VLLADEDEWGRGGVGVVGAGGELENFLDGPRRAGEDHNAGLGMGEEPVFADGIGEILRDALGEDVRRFVAVEPGRDAEAAGVGRRGVGSGEEVASAQAAGGPGADVVGEGRDVGDDGQAPW
jgi:hypothetical protein